MKIAERSAVPRHRSMKATATQHPPPPLIRSMQIMVARNWLHQLSHLCCCLLSQPNTACCRLDWLLIDIEQFVSLLCVCPKYRFSLRINSCCITTNRSDYFQSIIDELDRFQASERADELWTVRLNTRDHGPQANNRTELYIYKVYFYCRVSIVEGINHIVVLFTILYELGPIKIDRHTYERTIRTNNIASSPQPQPQPRNLNTNPKPKPQSNEIPLQPLWYYVINKNVWSFQLESRASTIAWNE